ncbi:hypothetical protein BT69DRAFT_357758 [Atractiella rhizophila]|nr:hypothetical protein BT69DRAFT_357758 [Atractiella rhizophila]
MRSLHCWAVWKYEDNVPALAILRSRCLQRKERTNASLYQQFNRQPWIPNKNADTIRFRELTAIHRTLHWPQCYLASVSFPFFSLLRRGLCLRSLGLLSQRWIVWVPTPNAAPKRICLCRLSSLKRGILPKASTRRRVHFPQSSCGVTSDMSGSQHRHTLSFHSNTNLQTSPRAHAQTLPRMFISKFRLELLLADLQSPLFFSSASPFHSAALLRSFKIDV